MRTFLWMSCVLLAAALQGQAEAPCLDGGSPVVRRVLAYMEDSLYAYAQEAIREGVASYPDRSRLLVLDAVIEGRQGNLERMQERLLEARLHLGGDSCRLAVWHYGRAQWHALRGRPTAAARELAAARSLGFGDLWRPAVEPNFDAVRGAPEFRALLELWDEDKTAEHWLAQGVARWRRGQHTEALADLELAAELDPRNPWPAYFKGVCFLKLQTPAEARAHFERFIQQTPDTLGLGWFFLGKIAFDEGDYEQAFQHLQTALERHLDARLGASSAEALRLATQAVRRLHGQRRRQHQRWLQARARLQPCPDPLTCDLPPLIREILLLFIPEYL